MTNQRDKLNLFTPIAFLIVVLIIGGVVSFGLNELNKHRSNSVVQAYTKETQAYIERNQQGLETLFTEVFPEHSCNPDQKDLIGCKKLSQTDLMSLIGDDLKDFSSMAFIKQTSSNGVLVLSLSGQISSIYPPNSKNEAKILSLLNQEVESIEWDRYTHRFRGNIKEVIVPVKNNEGKVIGAITRGVIE